MSLRNEPRQKCACSALMLCNRIKSYVNIQKLYKGIVTEAVFCTYMASSIIEKNYQFKLAAKQLFTKALLMFKEYARCWLKMAKSFRTCVIWEVHSPKNQCIHAFKQWLCTSLCKGTIITPNSIFIQAIFAFKEALESPVQDLFCNIHALIVLLVMHQ